MADLTTLGVTFGYGIETVKGTKPTKFTWLQRCNSIGEINLETEKIDVSALEDLVTQYAKGRADTGGNWDVSFNVNNDVIRALKELFSASDAAKATDKDTWFEVVFPDLEDAFFVKAQTPPDVPLPEVGDNEKASITLSLAIVEYVGLDTKVAFTTGE